LAEGREHRLLATGLARSMAAAGVRIEGAEAPGWPRSPWVGGRRPDVVGELRVGGAAAAGEAKRGPEMWRCLAQLRHIAAALPGRGPAGADALLILGVGYGWEEEAEEVARAVTGTRTAVVVWPGGLPPSE
jgi:hypothetical protein